MYLREAIARANEMRINTINDSTKSKWAYTVDCGVAEIMHVEKPRETFPADRELLMPSPHDEIYVLYIAAMIDYQNGEIELYRNDIAVFEEAMKQASAWYRRNHPAKNYGGWKI